ncbi:Ergosterol biosynthesis ERG4/ERG24 [Metarhizium album ARSEF 1941]|uniref:Delta(24(24(1)))-sterol reductase n=1 Tax=Metarhizium album (strain ARSEF 1941) TaxID=1081103 RepID=A0A0B2WVM7_METAS|nr:Ergosterol biosynthesis ERG4/ERG24 [Metarhizium album ARSEF 1941]KHN97507.1 Ergosterol biosynthesis ERG4/ERG24 [Metarhizium album ARSEF 1941]
MAHYLYVNACAKGEESITSNWDMYFEKLGLMLTFWNMAGIPFSYCHCAIYFAHHHPSEYRWSRYALFALVVVYLSMYWMWDTSNSQKNPFRQMERQGKLTKRNTFPQLPWQIVENWRPRPASASWSPFPWFYSVFFMIMIIHRAMRDIERCRRKYGHAWRQHEKGVPYLFIPYVV